VLRIKNLESGYGRLKVLKKVTMHIRTGEIVTIIGANGAGKTTLLRTVSGLIPARSGEILFDMKEIGKVPRRGSSSSGARSCPRDANCSLR